MSIKLKVGLYSELNYVSENNKMMVSRFATLPRKNVRKNAIPNSEVS